jgi:Holliday junction resolvasome RuvABC endonuclease subunit
VLGLDLSNRAAGITVVDQTGRKCYEDVSGFALAKADSEESRVLRICTVRDACLRPFNLYKIDSVWCEDYAFSRAGSSSVTGLAELRGAIKAMLWEKHKVTMKFAGVRTVRSRLLGKGWGGSKTKRQILDFLSLHGREFQDDNSMDAWLTGTYGMLVDVGVIDETGNQRSGSGRKRGRGVKREAQQEG